MQMKFSLARDVARVFIGKLNQIWVYFIYIYSFLILLFVIETIGISFQINVGST